MRFPPSIPGEKIKAVIAAQYALVSETLHFLPMGEDGWVFRLGDHSGKYWFVKLRETLNQAALIIPAFLHHELNLDFILAPQLTRNGQWWVDLENMTLVVHPYLDGSVMGDIQPGRDLQYQVGSLVRTLHESTRKLPEKLLQILPRETFNRHQALTRRVLSFARNQANLPRVGLDLTRFIQRKMRVMNEMMESARKYGEIARQKGAPFALCHADIHLFNILITREGSMKVIDWDNVMLAPRERDLMFLGALTTGDPRLEGYGAAPIDRQVIVYYMYEWVIQEFADYGEQVFFRNLSPEQKQAALVRFIELFEPGEVIDQAREADRQISRYKG